MSGLAAAIGSAADRCGAASRARGHAAAIRAAFGPAARRGAALLCALFALAVPAHAIDREQAFEDPELNARYHALIREVRCLVCQNQTISDSNADLAADLRREIRGMIAAGRSDAEIVEFLTARYGDFVMYRPPLKPSTWALWAGPGVLLALGALIFARIVRARSAQPLGEDPAGEDEAA